MVSHHLIKSQNAMGIVGRSITANYRICVPLVR